MADPTELMALLGRLLRCDGPGALLSELAGPAPLPPGPKRLYVRRGAGVEVFAADGRNGARHTGMRAGGELVGADVLRVLTTGRFGIAASDGGTSVLLPLRAGGEVTGVLAAPLGPGDPSPGGAGRFAEGLVAVADCCALVLRAHRAAGPLAEAVDAAQAGVFAWDFSADDVYWDDRTCAVYGVDPARFDGRGDTFFELLHPEDVPVLQAAIAEVTEAAVAGRLPGSDADPGRYRLEYRVVHPDGSVHRLTECGRIVLDDVGRPARALGLVWESGGQGAAPGPRPAAASGDGSRDGSRDAFLYTLTRALSQAVSVSDVTRVMTDLARPALGAENLLLGVVEGGHLEIVGESCVSPALEFLRAPAYEVMAFAAERETPLFVEDLTGPWRDGVPRPEADGPLPARSWVVLSLGSLDRTRGACLISFARPRRFDEEERTFYTAVAVILTQSLERARLFDTQHQRATDLQKAMLPSHLPALDELSAHSCYLPGTQGMHIGGDWYDVLLLGDGTAALVIGDVQGHDAHASAVMGQLRVALRACAEPGLSPGAVLGQVNRVFCDLDTDRFATCAYLVLSPADGALTGARAGHPHPVRVGPDSTGELLLAGGPPLGVDPAARYPTTPAVLGPRDTLVLFTDGLVERRDADIDVCVRAMTDDVRVWLGAGGERRAGDLAALVDFLTGRDAPGRIDDLALLAVRRRGRAAGRG